MSSALQNTGDCSPSIKSADMTHQIPDLTAETPHGTVMKWEELFEVISSTLDYHLFKIHFTHLQTKAPRYQRFFFLFLFCVCIIYCAFDFDEVILMNSLKKNPFQRNACHNYLTIIILSQ